jgi:hypothetical protein
VLQKKKEFLYWNKHVSLLSLKIMMAVRRY